MVAKSSFPLTVQVSQYGGAGRNDILGRIAGSSWVLSVEHRSDAAGAALRGCGVEGDWMVACGVWGGDSVCCAGSGAKIGKSGSGTWGLCGGSRSEGGGATRGEGVDDADSAGCVGSACRVVSFKHLASV